MAADNRGKIKIKFYLQYTKMLGLNNDKKKIFQDIIQQYKLDFKLEFKKEHEVPTDQGDLNGGQKIC